LHSVTALLYIDTVVCAIEGHLTCENS